MGLKNFVSRFRSKALREHIDRFPRLQRKRTWFLKPSKWGYKRHVLPRSKWPKLIEEITEKLKDREFFGQLPGISRLLVDPQFLIEAPFTTKNVKRYEFEGVPIAIKNTRGLLLDGLNFQEIRESILVHHREIGQGKRYKLVTPKIFKRVGQFLIMEFMEGVGYAEIRKYSELERKSSEEALDELQDNFDKLVEEGKIPKSIQIGHSTFLGNTNPKHPEKGQWLIALPYDFG